VCSTDKLRVNFGIAELKPRQSFFLSNSKRLSVKLTTANVVEIAVKLFFFKTDTDKKVIVLQLKAFFNLDLRM